MRIRIVTEKTGTVEADIIEERNPKTVEAILNALPFKTKANIWGDEIYFSIPVKLMEENSQETVELGDLGYWPPGQSFCIFFGLTPTSKGDIIRPASPVNVFGKLLLDPKVFKKVRNGDSILVEKT